MVTLPRMRITTHTPDELTITHRPWFATASLVTFTLIFTVIAIYLMRRETPGGAFFFLGTGLGLVFLLVFVRRTRILFSRPDQNVSLERRSLLRTNIQTIALSQIEKAALQQTRSETGASFRVVLMCEPGEAPRRVPLTDHYTSARAPTAVAQAINDWLGTAPVETAAPEAAPVVVPRRVTPTLVATPQVDPPNSADA